jgi:uncharacterized RDD family membrane protein YckC
MVENWWYAENNQRVGPVLVTELVRLYGTKVINSETNVAMAGWDAWKPLRDAQEEVRASLGRANKNLPPLPQGASQSQTPADDVPAAKDGLRPTAASASSRIAASTAEAADEMVNLRPRPWTRWWARMLDIEFAIAVLLLIFPETLADQIDRGWYLVIPAAFLWIFLEPVFLVWLGTTPGKWIMRIQLSTNSSQPLTFRQALSRSFTVWWRGMGIGFPLLSALAMVWNAGSLRKHGITPWDKSGEFRVTHTRVGILRGTALSIALVVLATGVASIRGGISI